ncbi:MAG TPA: cytochrome c-type biogenesis protein CcmH [Gemmatimonadaceae bacterium]|nr:cytochrome c-type biogenesis protein CcmH [Gemmatimonadaceae bacterium]
MSGGTGDERVGELLVTRRHFLAAVAAGGAAAGAVVLGGRSLAAQQPQSPVPNEPAAQGSDPAANQGAANVPMNENAYREVRRPPKPGAAARLSAAERDALEHQIHCQCGCVLDVYTCRTTDFSCGVSPAMHTDVMGLVEGGYSADEIIAAFRDTYGERVLMAPPKQGFNWAGYVTPFAALGTGAVVVAALIRKWGRRATATAAAARGAQRAAGVPDVAGVDATAEELARIEAAVRGDGR